MKSNSCYLIFFVIISLISGIFERHVSGYERVDPLNTIFLEPEAVSESNLLFIELNEELNQSIYEQEPSTKDDGSAPQAQPIQPYITANAPQQNNEPYEQSKLQASNKKSNATLSEYPYKLKQWIKNNCLALLYSILVVIVIPGILYWRFEVWKDKKRRKSDIEDKIELNFDNKMPWSAASSEERRKRLFSFYTGSLDADPTICVPLTLDAERKLLTEVTTLIQKKGQKEWFHIPIYGDRRQGKSVFMARLAHNLSWKKGRLHLWSKYSILWSKPKGTQFRKNLEDGENLLQYVVDLSKWRKYYAQKKRLIVFIDDFSRPDLEGSANIAQLGRLKDFLNELCKKRISIITSSSDGDARIDSLSEKAVKLKLEEEDVTSILSKLVQEGIIISQQIADAFASDHISRRLYKKQLFAFLSQLYSKGLLFPKAVQKVSFMETFKEQFRNLSDDERLPLKMIALCQLVDIYLPETILQQAFLSVFQQLQSGLCGLVRKEHREGDDDSYIYHMGGPFLAKWFLEEKFSVRTSNELKNAFSTLYALLLTDEIFNKYPQTHIVINLILKRLAAGWHIPIFDIPGKPLAKGLFHKFKNRLDPYFNILTNAGDLVLWAATMRDIGEYDVATKLYWKASEKIQIPIDPPTVQNMRTLVSLAMGLSAMSDANSKRKAVSLLERIAEKYATAKNQPWVLVKVVHKLAETLYKTGQTDKALEVVNKLPPNIPADALLLQLKGDILVAQSDLKGANDSFRQSIEAASKDASRSPQTLFNCLLHYADFLVTNHIVAKKLGENPESYLKQAEDFFNNKVTDLDGYETLLNVSAKWKKVQKDFPGAKATYKDCLSYCSEKGIIHPHSWNDFARLLIDYGSQFEETSYAEWLAEAERLCREVIDYSDVDAQSRRIAAHILGGLVGNGTSYIFDGKQRPNFSEAVLILQDAFESPEPDRNDDQKKTYQDAITHNLLKNVYLRWYDSNQPVAEGRDTLLAQADFHFEKAFSGLPRPDLCSPKVIEHALLAQAHYAAFLWKPRAGTPNLSAAEQNYKDAIAKFKANFHPWPGAYELYEFYANFLYDTRRAKPPAIASLLREALQLVLGNNREARATISRKLAHNLHIDLLNNLRSLTSEDAGNKIDEIIRLFADTLKLTRENRTAGRAGGELSYLFFAPHRGLLRDLITKTRVEKVKDILYQAWVACPTNKEALSGILVIGDAIIDKEFHDEDKLKYLAELINQKAFTDKIAGQVLGNVLIVRKNSQFRGRLTDILMEQ